MKQNYVSNLKAMTEDPLTEEEMKTIETLDEKQPSCERYRYFCGKAQKTGTISGMKKEKL